MLSAAEVRDLIACEEVIAKGWDTFVDVGRALARIRDKRLYRADFDTFDAYCRQKWHYGKSQAYRLIGAAEVIQHLSPIGDIPLPRSESQVRPLIGLRPEQVKTVWCEVVRKAGKQSVTAKLVRQMADRLRPNDSKRHEGMSKTPTTQQIEASLVGAEELLAKAKQLFKIGDNAAVVALLHKLRARLSLSLPGTM
jgi:hypothetical protein